MPAMGGHSVREHQVAVGDAADGELIATGIACEKPATVGAKKDRALTAEAAACSAASGCKRTVRVQTTVGTPAVRQHVVCACVVVHRVNRAGRIPAVAIPALILRLSWCEVRD